MWITLLSISNLTKENSTEKQEYYWIIIVIFVLGWLLVCACRCCFFTRKDPRNSKQRIYAIQNQNHTNYPNSNQVYPGRGYSGFTEAGPPISYESYHESCYA